MHHQLLGLYFDPNLKQIYNSFEFKTKNAELKIKIQFIPYNRKRDLLITISYFCTLLIF